MTDGLSQFVLAFRQISNYHYVQIFLQDGTPGTCFNLLTRLQENGGVAPTTKGYQILEQDPYHWFSPTRYLTCRRISAHYAIESQENTWFNPT